MPTGPDEDSSWWYANKLLGVTLLVIYIWSEEYHPSYHVYCSHCRDQSAPFVVACLQHLHKTIDARTYGRHVMFADVGTHFRNGYTLTYWSDDLTAWENVVETEWLHFLRAMERACAMHRVAV